VSASLLRVGLVGAGQISHYAAADFAAHPDVRLVATADPSAERLGELSEKFQIEARYGSAEEMLAGAELDAIYIATPNVWHAPLARLALAHGKHVLLEKPFALNETDARSVVDAAARSGRVLSLSMNQRFRADSQRLRAFVASGALGDVYHARAFWFRRAGIPRLGTWFGKRELAGGGALLDIGVHLLDLALFTMGNFEPVSVSGATHASFGARGLGEGGWGRSDVERGAFDVEEFATALIRFANGATLSLDASWAMHQAEAERHDLVLHGTEGAASCYPAEFYRFGKEPGVYLQSTLEPVPLEYPHQSPIHNFVEQLRGREAPCVAIGEALVVQRVLDAIYESAKLGREIPLV